MATTVQGLIRKHRPLWNVTIRNPFVKGVRDGTMERELFDRWLVQARHMLEGHHAPVCRLLAAAPREDRPLLLQSLELIHAEIEWQRRRIVERGLDPAARVHPVISAMANYLVALGFQPYVVGLVAFWTQGRTYVDAWKARSPAPGMYRDFLRRFHQPRAVEWGRRMDRAANRALAGATESERDAAEQAFLRVVNDKLLYWTMTLS
jgi:thiaminase